MSYLVKRNIQIWIGEVALNERKDPAEHRLQSDDPKQNIPDE